MSKPMLIKNLAETVACPAERGVRMAVYRKAEVPARKPAEPAGIPVPISARERTHHE